jgi:hypothetical protein
MKIFEFLCENDYLIAVRSRFNVKQTVDKLKQKGFNPISYLELDELDAEFIEIDYTFK